MNDTIAPADRTILPGHGRYEYSAIGSRPDFSWPGGRRLAAYVAINIESFAFGTETGPTLTPLGDPPHSEHRKFAWRDYGPRVGYWRILRALGERGIPAAHILNAYSCAEYGDIVTAIKDRSEEVIGHGRTNSEPQGGLLEEQECTMIADATRTLTQTFGRAPQGWMSPGATQSRVTLDLLHEAGYRYSLDWPMDDQPVWLRTRGGRILSIPYPLELNDYPMVLTRGDSAVEFARMALDQFDEMLADSDHHSVVYGLVLHTFISGQPGRVRALKTVFDRMAEAENVWLTTPGEIADYMNRNGAE